jgi:hypothetical protein
MVKVPKDSSRRGKSCRGGVRWVRFSKSRAHVNGRQLVSTGVNLCQPVARGDAPKCPQMSPGGFALRNTFSRGHSGALGGIWGRSFSRKERRDRKERKGREGCLVFFAIFAIFVVFASHLCTARKSRPLSLPPRCALVMTNAHRARSDRGWRCGNAENNFQNRDFGIRARCAFVMTKAQRAT